MTLDAMRESFRARWAAGWVVAKREWFEQAGSLRFIAISLLAVCLTPVSVYVGARDYQARLSDCRALLAEWRQVVDGPAGRAVRGVDLEWKPGNELKVLRVIRCPEPMSVLARGLDASLPSYWDFSALGAESGPPAGTELRLADTSSHLDLEFLIRVFLGFLAILIGFDAVAGEKETGTLKASLSNPIPRPLYLAGKLAGGGLALACSLASTLAVAALTCRWILPELVTGAPLKRLALQSAAWGVYLGCIFALAILISCLASSRKTAFVAAMVFWFVLVLALQPLGALLARAGSPAGTEEALLSERTRLAEEMEEGIERRLGEIYRQVVGAEAGETSGVIFSNNKAAILRAMDPALKEHLRRRRQTLEALEGERQRALRGQQRIAQATAKLSPAALVESITTELADTGDAHASLWRERVRAHQGALAEALFDDPPHLVVNNAGAILQTLRREPPSWEQLPRLQPPGDRLADALRRALPSFLLLLCYLAGFLAASWAAFSRYEIR